MRYFVLASVTLILLAYAGKHEHAREGACMVSCTSCPELNTQKCQELCR